MFKFIFPAFYILLFVNAYAIEPSSGIRCSDLKNNNYVEFLFKKNDITKSIKAYKRIEGNFVEVGDVVGKKLSSFILFEDNTIFNSLDFAWHLDEVTKNLKPFVLSNIKENNLKLPNELSCISMNFWY